MACRGVWASLIISVSHAIMHRWSPWEWRRTPGHVCRSLNNYMGVSVGSGLDRSFPKQMQSACIAGVVTGLLILSLILTEPRTRAPQYWQIKTPFISCITQLRLWGCIQSIWEIYEYCKQRMWASGWCIAFSNLIMETGFKGELSLLVRCWHKPKPNHI